MVGRAGRAGRARRRLGRVADARRGRTRTAVITGAARDGQEHAGRGRPGRLTPRPRWCSPAPPGCTARRRTTGWPRCWPGADTSRPAGAARTRWPGWPRTRTCPGSGTRPEPCCGWRYRRCGRWSAPARRVLVVEDLHALDPASLNLIGELAAAGPAGPAAGDQPAAGRGGLARLLTARTLARLSGAPGAVRQHLGPLGAGAGGRDPRPGVRGGRSPPSWSPRRCGGAPAATRTG